MQSVQICHSCGRTIEKDFIYCPWCGLCQLEEKISAQTADEVYERLTVMQSNGQQRRITKLADSLDKLEKDLTLMVIQAEMHR